MKKFYYICRINNETRNGYINANNIQDAAELLEKQGFTIIQLKEIHEDVKVDYNATILPFAHNEKKAFFNALHFQYKAGIPILETFEFIANGSSQKNVKQFCAIIVKKLKEGITFEEIFKQYANIIEKVNAQLLIAGEKSGKLGEVSYDILKMLEKKEEVHKEMISKARYYGTVFAMAVFAFVFFNSCLIPAIENVLESEYSVVKQVVNILFGMLKSLAFVVGGALIIITVVKKNLTKFQNAVLNSMLVRKSAQFYSFMMLFRTMSIAYSAGYPIIDSIDLVYPLIKSENQKRKMQKVKKMIQEGTQVASAFEISGLFDEFSNSSVSTAELSGEYDKVFKTISLNYENQYDIEADLLLKKFNFVILFIVGIMVLVVLCNFYVRIYSSLGSTL